ELEARKQQYEHYQYQVFNDLRNSGVNLVPLSEIGRWYGGGTPSKSESSYWTNGSIPWISPKDMGSPIVTQTEDYITNEAVSQSSTKLVPKDSIAIVVRSSILEHTLPIAFVPIESSLNQDMKAVIPAEGISARYVFHAMRAARSDILRQVKRTGGSVASLDSKKLWKFEIPVPDMQEQERVNQFFDRFDALTGDLSAGLPAELVARRQQYDYYRDKLLTFKELEPAS
ncbi:restriction endonuclease subunit S, partial [Glutamicibacter sp. AOP5-B1-3]